MSVVECLDAVCGVGKSEAVPVLRTGFPLRKMDFLPWSGCQAVGQQALAVEVILVRPPAVKARVWPNGYQSTL